MRSSGQTVALKCDITWRKARPFLHFLVSAHSAQAFDLGLGLVLLVAVLLTVLLARLVLLSNS